MASGAYRDLTRGSVFKNLVLFALPILITNLLQQMYHAADVIVVGNFAQNSKISLAAVGSTSQITSLLVSLFNGLAVGANITCAHRFGSGDQKSPKRVIYTSLTIALVCGTVMSIVGFVLAKPLLTLMGSPSTVIDYAAQYMRIIFIGLPASMYFSFGAAVLRARGDSKRSMYILSVTGIVNVLLNLVFVIVFHLDSAGVAWATIIAQYLSALAITWILFHPEGDFCLKLSEFVFDKEDFASIVKIGLPVGFNSILFSVSNVAVTARVNSLGDVAVAGVSAATSLGNITHTIAQAFFTATCSFAGQNYGAKMLSRIRKLRLQGLLLVESIYFAVNLAITFFPYFFMGLYTQDLQVIQAGIPKLLLNNWGYMVYVAGEIANGCLRGMGKTLVPTICNIACVCGVRLIWVLGIFPFLPQTTAMLFICYPLSWLATALAQNINFAVAMKKETLAAEAK